MDDELVWHPGDEENHWYTGSEHDPKGFGVKKSAGVWQYYKVRNGWNDMPGEFTLEEAKAMAVVLYRMEGSDE